MNELDQDEDDYDEDEAWNGRQRPLSPVTIVRRTRSRLVLSNGSYIARSANEVKDIDGVIAAMLHEDLLSQSDIKVDDDEDDIKSIASLASTVRLDPPTDDE